MNHWPMLSSEDREREYSPSSCVGGNIEPFLAEYLDQSEASRLWCARNGHPVLTLQYGALGSQSVDLVVPAVPHAPVVIFIHGGYWQQLSKKESFSPAMDFVPRGVAFAAVDYTLAPAASLDEIVAECRRAVAMILAEAEGLNIDSKRIILAGSSAGAHLAAMVAMDPSTSWRPAGLVLLSGIYDLEPLIGTTINEALNLDAKAAGRNSPALLPISEPIRAVVAWGDNETDQFKLQSAQFASQLADAGASPSKVEAAGRNHFNILSDLGDIQTELGRAVADLIKSTEGTNADL